MCTSPKENNIDQSVEQMAFNDDLISQPEFVTETTRADYTANIKAKDNHRSNKKSNNSNILVSDLHSETKGLSPTETYVQS